MQAELEKRYRLHEQLGAGGMGAVYRAHDRLTGSTVALKRVLVAPGQLLFNSRDDTSDLRVALAREFQLLASLRHPNIITVLDYGFDTGGQPFFTMRLLDEPRDILRAARGQPEAYKVALLVQVLHALAYVHRRSILHRDIKPGNVLVTADGQVKVLDFGLAIPAHALAEVEHVMVGTFAYVAPELFGGELPSVASDLYAVGVIACEMFRGERPFADQNLGSMIGSIMNDPPDLRGVPVMVRTVLERLLAKSPADRYAGAEAVIEALCAAVGQPVPAESAAVRESFLQAAQFVGREAEFAELMRALRTILGSHPTSTDAAASEKPFEKPSPQTPLPQGEGLERSFLPISMTHEQKGAGDEGKRTSQMASDGQTDSAWLVGGESGVGKSRLLNELRTRALVEGVLVLHGQSAADGGQPYQLWRDVARRLALVVALSEMEASILKALVPDIGDLLGQDVPDAPPVEGKPGQQRLQLMLAALFRRLNQPALLILEDLHWAGEGLDLLRGFQRVITDCPLLVIGSYRDDDAPGLPEELPWMHPIRLERLAEPAIAELSASMLGAAGRQAPVVELLRRETEGNAFFLVEVVRALAEEAGRLGDVGRTTLPEKVFTGGVQQVIRRRLGRVPDDARPLLNLAAVAGRQLDEGMLKHLIGVRTDGALALDNWLTACANAAVLDRHDGRWRFSHDKLRETVLADLPPDDVPALNRQVAEALEAVYPGDDSRAGALADHWYAAGDTAKAAAYARQAGRQMLAVSSFHAALRLSERILALLPPDHAERLMLLMIAGEANARLGDFPPAVRYQTTALELARQLGDRLNEAAALRLMGNTAFSQGDYSAARDYALASLHLSLELGDRRGTAVCENTLGMMAIAQGNHAEARAHLNRSLEGMRELDDRRVVATILHNLGYLAYTEGDHPAARRYLEEARAVQRHVGDQILAGQSLLLLGMVAFAAGDYDMALAYAHESQAIQQTIGDRRSLSDSINILGWVAEARGEFASAQAHYQRALTLSRDIGNRQGIGYCLNNVASLARKTGDAANAVAWADEAISTFDTMGDRRGLGYSLNVRAMVAYSNGDYPAALDYATRSRELATGNDDRYLQAASLVTLVFTKLAQAELAAARGYLRDGLRVALTVSAPSVLLELLAGAAWLFVRDGQPERGAELVGLITAQPMSHNSDVKEWLAQLRPALSAALPDHRTALERGAAQDAAAAAAQLADTL